MISVRWRKLLPTLLSRVRRVGVGRPEQAQAERWLADQRLGEQVRWLPFFGYAPQEIASAAKTGRLKMLDALVADLLAPDEPLTLAGRWENLVKSNDGLKMEELVTTLQKWLFDLGCSVAGAPLRYFPDRAQPIAAMARRLSFPAIVQAEREVTRLRALAAHPLNPRLFLEDLCLRAFKPLHN